MLVQLSVFGLVTLLVQNALSMRCWECSSDVDRTCLDPFNTTELLYGRRGGLNNPYNSNPYNNNPYDQQNYRGAYPQGRAYENPSYNPGFAQQQQYNPNPALRDCNEAEARRDGMKMVCLKRIIVSQNGAYRHIQRRCDRISMNSYPGTCNDPVNRGMYLEFCETCDFDGCNSANGLKTNTLFAIALPVILLLYFKF